jgi:hypothetical protein
LTSWESTSFSRSTVLHEDTQFTRPYVLRYLLVTKTIACDCKSDKCDSVFNDTPVPVLSVGRSVFQLTIFKRAETVPWFVLTKVSFSFKTFSKFLVQKSSEAQKLRWIDWITVYLTTAFYCRRQAGAAGWERYFECGGSVVATVCFGNRCMTSDWYFCHFNKVGYNYSLF